jgi:hypothetical protein
VLPQGSVLGAAARLRGIERLGLRAHEQAGVLDYYDVGIEVVPLDESAIHDHAELT